VYPVFDEDGIARRNALNCLADPMAVVDRVWRLPLVVSRQHGRFSLRDIEIARGQASPGPMEGKADEAAIREAFGELPLEDLTELDRSVTDAGAERIDARMRSESGRAGPTRLLTQLAKLNRIWRERVALRSDNNSAASEGGGAAQASTGGASSQGRTPFALDGRGLLRRNDVSPIPMLIERAKRLVAKDFLEVLADIAPDALAVARSAGGLKD
jgi:type VI secretion system protein ImpA